MLTQASEEGGELAPQQTPWESGTALAQGQPAFEIATLVEIGEGREQREVEAAATQGFLEGGEGGSAAPADLGQYLVDRHTGGQQVEAPVRGGSHHDPTRIFGQQGLGSFEETGAQPRNIRAHQDDGSSGLRRFIEGVPKPCAECPTPLLPKADIVGHGEGRGARNLQAEAGHPPRLEDVVETRAMQALLERPPGQGQESSSP